MPLLTGSAYAFETAKGEKYDGVRRSFSETKAMHP